MNLTVVYVVIYVVAILASLWSQSKVGAFLKQYPSISDPSALEAFKELARVNMYMALVQIPVLLAGIVLGLILIFGHGFIGLLVVLVANVLLFLVGRKGKSLEKAVHGLPAASDELRQEHQKIVQTWVKKALPDF